MTIYEVECFGWEEKFYFSSVEIATQFCEKYEAAGYKVFVNKITVDMPHVVQEFASKAGA